MEMYMEERQLFTNTFCSFNQNKHDKAQKSVPSNEITYISQTNASEFPVFSARLRVDSITFTQETVSTKFSNGILLDDVSKGLKDGTLSPDSIPCIHVVQWLGQWWSLDNRRLRVFKDANIEEVEVKVCDLLDPKIKKEFDSKKTNKSADLGGGMVRAISKAPFVKRQANKHFNEGNFIFTKIILSWNVSQLKMPSWILRDTTPLPFGFLNRENYYKRFEPLILEEARAVLHAGRQMNTRSYEGKFISSKFSNKFDNPCQIRFRIEGHRVLIKPADMFILTQSDCELFAMACYDEKKVDDTFAFKVVISRDFRKYYFESTRNQERLWHIQPIGSVITQMRMYEACLAKTNVPFEESLLQSDCLFPKPVFFDLFLPLLSDLKGYPMLCDDKPIFSSLPSSSLLAKEIATDNSDVDDCGLNPSQREAVQSFLDINTGLQLVQGPPGTGKTTTLVALLKELLHTKQRTLVSAPSNKAIQLLAERFIEACPTAPILFIGAEDHLHQTSEAIKQIYLDTRLCEIRKQIQDQIEALQARIRKNQSERTIPNESVLNSEFPTNERSSQLIIKAFAHQANNLSSITECKEFLNDMASHIDARRLPFSELSNILDKIQSPANKSLSSKIEQQLLNEAIVIFATLSSCGRKVLKEATPIDNLVIDEAGQAVEAETLIPLQLKPKKCLLVGDTKQLPATVLSEKAKNLKFDRSLMWRLFEDCKYSCKLLDTQYRMHPEISRWPAKQYYDNKLQNADGVLNHEYNLPAQVPDYLQHYSFINVEGEELSQDKSFVNREELSAIKMILEDLKKYYPMIENSQLGIITFYKAQANLLRKELACTYNGIQIHTVDGFQGGECDFILISFVRANHKGKIGFLDNFRRLNVAITRARFGLFMFGDVATLNKADHDIKELLEDAASRNKIYSYKKFVRHTTKSVSVSGNKRTFFDSTPSDHRSKLAQSSEANNNSQKLLTDQDTKPTLRTSSKRRRINPPVTISFDTSSAIRTVNFGFNHKNEKSDSNDSFLLSKRNK